MVRLMAVVDRAVQMVVQALALLVETMVVVKRLLLALSLLAVVDAWRTKITYL
jgi:hypothetical protein